MNNPLQLIFYATCISEDIPIPFTDYSLEKDKFALGVVLLDIIVIMSFYIFTQVLRKRQIEYIEEFELQKIQMMDFTVKVSYLPNDLAYGDNEHVLKAHLMSHFEKVLQRDQ